ncbi:adenylosuccinate synthetase [gamma proteobacterium HTCC5015]|nr:adenylosuccinate synthetase [gamma proteobacterium HTCC5015]
MEHILLFFVAVVANLFSALAGGGAGLLQFPVLIFLGLPFGTALATHKVASVALGVGATTRHWREGRFELGFSAFILLCGVPGVLLGANVILQFPERWAELCLGLLTASLGLYSAFKRDLGQSALPKRRNTLGYAWGGLGIFAIGFLNGSLTSGTGLFLTLWLILWFGFDYQRAVAYTLVLVGLVWNGSGAIALGVQGTIEWSWLPALIAGSLIGGYAGAHLSIAKGNPLIKRCFEVITLLVGLSLIVRGSLGLS